MVNKKRLKNLLGTLWFSSVFLFGGYLIFSDANIEDSNLINHTGKIINIGITENTNSMSYGSKTSKVLFLDIEGVNERIANYNTKQDYRKLLTLLAVGDTINIKYKKSEKTGKLNIDLYELNFKNKNLIKQSSYRISRYICSVIAYILGTFTLLYGFRKDRKFKKDLHLDKWKF